VLFFYWRCHARVGQTGKGKRRAARRQRFFVFFFVKDVLQTTAMEKNIRWW